MMVDRKGKRRIFKETINIVGVDYINTIVEIGSIRGPSILSGGHSTLQWPTTCNLWTCDVNPKATELTRRMLFGHPSCIAINVDGLKFLKMFPGVIDILYLDGPFNKREAYELARGNMSLKHSAILIDDTDIPETTIAEGVPQVIELAGADGYELMPFDNCVQTLLVRIR